MTERGRETEGLLVAHRELESHNYVTLRFVDGPSLFTCTDIPFAEALCKAWNTSISLPAPATGEREKALEEAAALCDHRAFLVHTHNPEGVGKELAWLEAATALRELSSTTRSNNDSRWRDVALALGEELAATGPAGYYAFTSQQWLEWAQEAASAAIAAAAIRALRSGESGPAGETGGR